MPERLSCRLFSWAHHIKPGHKKVLHKVSASLGVSCLFITLSRFWRVLAGKVKANHHRKPPFSFSISSGLMPTFFGARSESRLLSEKYRKKTRYLQHISFC